jgi:Na+/proline symporter
MCLASLKQVVMLPRIQILQRLIVVTGYVATAAIKLSMLEKSDYGRKHNMKKFVAAAVIAVSCMSSAALAGERVGDAALGGLSGAVVFGPVGALAGIAVGYTAGPAIARSWGLKRYPRRSATRRR